MKKSVKMDSYFLSLIPVLIWIPCVIALLVNPHLSHKTTTIIVWSILFSSMSLYFFLGSKKQFDLIDNFSKQNSRLRIIFLNKIVPADDDKVWAYYSFKEEVLAIKMPKDANFNNYQLDSSKVVNQFNDYELFFPGSI